MHPTPAAVVLACMSRMSTADEHAHHHHAGHDHETHAGHATHDHLAGHGDHAGHDHGEQSLNRLSVSATIHCMTGCLIGDVVGMTIATALGWSNGASTALAVSLAFLFGYALTSLPLFKAGLTIGAVVPIVFAVDTFSIATMEFIDNAFILLVPGAAHAHLDEAIYWATMLGGFVIAFPFAFLVNRALLRRGKGHALVHAYHHH